MKVKHFIKNNLFHTSQVILYLHRKHFSPQFTLKNAQSPQQPHVMSRANDLRWVINRRAGELLKIFSHAKVHSVKEYKLGW